MRIHKFNLFRLLILLVFVFLCFVKLTSFYLKSQKTLIKSVNVFGKPYSYKDEVDFRIIVITFRRSQSLLTLLKTIDEIELDGDSGSLEIWIDRDKQGNVDNKTVEAAKSFQWKKGPTRVYVHRNHVGIYGQWIYTWRPRSIESKEIVLILEDDMNVSKYCYRWLKKVHGFYETSSIFAGATLQSDIVLSHDGSSTQLKGPKNHTVFMYKCLGTWGFSPKPSVWMRFQNWYKLRSKDREFCPCVPGILPTVWYKSFKQQKTEDSMWSVWSVYFAYQEKLFTVYSNLNSFNGDLKSCLSVNRREKGLHYDGEKGGGTHCQLLNNWKDNFVDFPESVTKLDWNGKFIDNY